MPRLGLGTYRSGPGYEAQQSALWALEAGYRLIDTALAYGNEPDVGAAVRRSGVPREEIFLTTKLENDDHGYEQTLAACSQSLKNLQIDYLDLYLIHWPVPGLRHQTWKAMEQLYSEGKCRAIGVSNYTIRHLQELLAESKTVPAINQVEFHPFLYQRELQEYCSDHGIRVESYSPLMKATRFDHPLLVKLAAKYGKTPAQILLRWHMEHGLIAIPKSVHREWIQENIDIWKFALAFEDVESLDGLNERRHLDWDPTDIP
ncbi:MAG: aldo/keto reductase [Deltaproteobacteria bacterium]